MKRACVIGWPVSHSLSPVIHGYWLEEHGLEGEYVKQPVEPKDFDGFLTSLAAHGFAGANITVPHKIEAHRLCELRDGAAQAIGAVNTVWLEGGKLAGSNTDAYGFTANLDSESPGWDRGGPAVVIGASVTFCLLTACVAGLSVPALLHALKLDPKIAAGPITLALADVFTLLFYFNLAKILL